MPTLLTLTASPRSERSVSRTLATEFTNLRAQAHPEETILLRDLGHEPVPHVTEDWVVGAFAPPEYQTPESKAAIAVSDELVREFLNADRYLIATPMYNLNIPSTLKAYIDQIVRVGLTFAVGANGYEGLVKGKKALFITTSGGAFRPGTPAGGYNFQEPYLRAIFGFIGVTDVEFVVVDNQNQGDEPAQHTRGAAEARLKALASSW